MIRFSKGSKNRRLRVKLKLVCENVIKYFVSPSVSFNGLPKIETSSEKYVASELKSPVTKKPGWLNFLLSESIQAII